MLSIRLLRKSLDSKKIGVNELVQELMGKFKENKFGAVLGVNEEETLLQARKAQEQIDSGETKPLLGIPCVHKDVFVTKAWKTTAGSKMLENYVSPFDATVVKKLASAGAVCLGKSSCDEFAMGSANQNCAYGVCRNPWDNNAVPGGSSGGSAALVAAGHAYFASGTDTGGSIRQPAAMCGVSGIKPTYGLVSRWGIVSYASSLDQAGPITRSAFDCGLVLNEMVGYDARDSTSQNVKKVDYCRVMEDFQIEGKSKPLEGFVFGIPREYLSAYVSVDVIKAFEEAVLVYKSLGAKVVDVSLPHAVHSVAAYYVIAPAEASSNLARFDGVRFGLRSKKASSLEEMYEETRSEGFGEEVKRRILVGTFVLSHGYFDAYYLQASRVRNLVFNDFRNAFKKCNFLLCPSSPTVAWDIGSSPIFGSSYSPPEGVPNEYLADLFTVGASLAGLPAISIPCGFGSDEKSSRPVGLQIIGPHFKESHILNVANVFQANTDWHNLRPENN